MLIQTNPGAGHFHAVRFYEDADSLARMVATFIAEGFIQGLPALVVATPEHRDAIVRKVDAMSFNLDQLRAQGDFVVIDARETLEKFLVDGMPDALKFDAVMLPLLDKITRRRSDCVIRAYGEMVDVLWREGHEAAAVRLEMLWNQLANKRDFSLLCGYSMGNFYKDAAFEAICKQHSHVLAADGSLGPAANRATTTR
jgi:hypothetical protein